MPFADYVFRYIPSLKGLVTPPDTSEMRFGHQRFAELDAQADEENWPPGWRMEHDVREANRKEVLAGRLSDDLWVFAYGSLIWDPAVYVEEYRFGSLHGWRRVFCMSIEGGRGSREQPGLMAALETGGRCEGVVFRLSAALVDQETEYMWRREMFAGAYRPIFQEVATPQGLVDALVFVMDQNNYRYAPGIPHDEAAKIIGKAHGRLGTNFEYLDSMVRHFDELGIEDEEVRQLHTVATELLSQDD